MNPNTAIVKPRWQNAPGFQMAWESVRRQFAMDMLKKAEMTALLDLATAMSRARVVRYDGPQIDAVVQAIADEEGEFLDVDSARLPFDPMFIEPIEFHADWRRPVCLIDTFDGEIQVTPFIRLVREQMVCGVMSTPDRRYGFTRIGELLLEDEIVDESIITSLCTVTGVLALLEASNVDLASPMLTRQDRRRAARDEASIPLEIVIGRQRTTYSKPRGGAITYSHAHDRAGNFAHHFALTADGTPNRFFRIWEERAPERAITVNGERCHRIWRQPTIVGVGDGPYVPKTRRTK